VEGREGKGRDDKIMYNRNHKELEERTFYDGIEEGRRAANEEDKKIEERKSGVKTYVKKREFGTFENQEVIVIQ
jgi:hypothetical protein